MTEWVKKQIHRVGQWLTCQWERKGLVIETLYIYKRNGWLWHMNAHLWWVFWTRVLPSLKIKFKRSSFVRLLSLNLGIWISTRLASAKCVGVVEEHLLLFSFTICYSEMSLVAACIVSFGWLNYISNTCVWDKNAAAVNTPSHSTSRAFNPVKFLTTTEACKPGRCVKLRITSFIALKTISSSLPLELAKELKLMTFSALKKVIFSSLASSSVQCFLPLFVPAY